MMDDFGCVEMGSSERAKAIAALLERPDRDGYARRHTLTYPGNPRQAWRYIARCQWIYLMSQRIDETDRQSPVSVSQRRST